ncbi:MAG: tRNA (adenosine(37)-N6)-threonylcarbamoyltransferase complex ATPase subunit type 1 TsaE [Deltaproteobacteria bacterium]|nr:tRNA (adenosine(37)-N6)-threonylcarbamoyltransferase complex ATPase subunit type 1 TsaE [Deltaproteobacteria bacterium]
MRRRLLSESAERTFALGRSIGVLARPGLVVALVGQLGAGKTLFTRGLHRGLGLRDDGWSGSPTFVLATRYSGSPSLLHADLYRVSSPAEVADLGIEDALGERAVVVVEWADRLPEALPSDRLTVRIEVLDEHRREVVLEAVGPVAEAVLAQSLPEDAAGGAESRDGTEPAPGSGLVTSEGARWR